MKKDGNRTDPLLFQICVCIFITTPGWHDYSCVHVCPREGYKLAACCRVIRGVPLTWRTPSPAETRRCGVWRKEEAEEWGGIDNTCDLPRARSHRCRSVAKSSCPSCHFGLQPKLLFAVITNILQRFPLQTPTARQLQNFCELHLRWFLSVPPNFLQHKDDVRSVVLTQINMFIWSMPTLFDYLWCNMEKYCLF